MTTRRRLAAHFGRPLTNEPMAERLRLREHGYPPHCGGHYRRADRFLRGRAVERRNHRALRRRATKRRQARAPINQAWSQFATAMAPGLRRIGTMFANLHRALLPIPAYRAALNEARAEQDRTHVTLAR